MFSLDKLINPRSQAFKKWMIDILKERYPKHDTIVERVGSQIQTNQDLQDLGKLAIDIYEAGYMKCFHDYKNKFDEMGIKVSIVPERK